MKPETMLRRRIHTMIKNEFPNTWIYHPAFILQSGVPDFLICFKGFFVAMEVKTATGHRSKLQHHILEIIKKAGGIIAVVRSIDEARNCLTNVEKSVSLGYNFRRVK